MLKLAIYLLCFVWLTTACTPTPATTNEDVKTPSSTAPTSQRRTDVAWRTAETIAAGVQFADAKKAVEQAGAGVASMSVINRDGTDYYLAVTRQPDNSIRVFMLRPFTSDGEKFTWYADPLPPGMYERLIAPPLATVSAP